MTVCGSFDLEDDDFFDDTFRNISDKELSNANILSESISTNNNVSDPSVESKSQENSSSAKGYFSLVQRNSNPDGNNSFSGHCRTNLSSQSPSEKSNTILCEVPDKIFHTPKTSSDVKFEKSAVINSRFTPGLPPKVKKRKFAGPAGVFTEKNDQCAEPDHTLKKKIEAEIEVQDITNSQFSADDLLLPSWQNLQADVSSKSLLATAKYYSIRRVYNETSKKKLPKHIVVPVLCVLLKKFNHTESHSVFIDDTGEIKGNIDKQVLSNFEECLKDGVSLILKKVTFLCNVLLLTQQSIVSIYLDDGTVKHIQEIDFLEPSTQKLLKPMSCQCSATHSIKGTLNSSHDSPENCIHRPTNHAAVIPRTPLASQKNCHSTKTNHSKSSSSLKEKFSRKMPVASANGTSSKNSAALTIPSATPGKTAEPYVGVPLSLERGSSRAVAFSTSKDGCESSKLMNDSVKVPAALISNEASDLFGGNSDLDEFDELLGNLDEKSFLEEF